MVSGCLLYHSVGEISLHLSYFSLSCRNNISVIYCEPLLLAPVEWATVNSGLSVRPRVDVQASLADRGPSFLCRWVIAIGGFAVSPWEMIHRDAYHIDSFAKGYRLILNMSHLLQADRRTESQLTVPEASDEETQYRMTLRFVTH